MNITISALRHINILTRMLKIFIFEFPIMYSRLQTSDARFYFAFCFGWTIVIYLKPSKTWLNGMPTTFDKNEAFQKYSRIFIIIIIGILLVDLKCIRLCMLLTLMLLQLIYTVRQRVILTYNALWIRHHKYKVAPFYCRRTSSVCTASNHHVKS